MNKTEMKNNAIWFTIGVFAIVMLIVLAINKNNKDYGEYIYEGVVVGVGDTIWEFAEGRKPDGMDIRDWVDMVKKDNDCGSTIYPNQHLRLRKYVEQ